AECDGAELLIYGAVKRETSIPSGKLEVIVTVEGPSTPLVIRKKDRVAGIWINRERVRIDAAPSFYAVATTGPLRTILSETDNLRHRITIPRAIRAIGLTDEATESDAFVDALLRIRRDNGAYRSMQGAVQLSDDTLFRTDIVLPANLTEGEYKVRLFLTRDGRVVDHQDRVIYVRKEGLERFLFNLSREQPLLYGLLALALAGLAGWGASEAFRLLRR
ncbi:MAG: hypothetical protein CFE34_09460, partial [Rhodobacteraceae bacterium PARR1]